MIRCTGITPLTARLEPWHEQLCADPTELAEALHAHGSPLNVLDVAALGRNAAELVEAATAHGVDLRVFFARKANKALAFVDEALRLGHGVDVASERELRQVLERGAAPADVVVTAAVKTRALLQLCVTSGATIALDNADELDLLRSVLRGTGRRALVAPRLAPTFGDGRAPTRFGMAANDATALLGDATDIDVVGVHFHLDGYAARDRVDAVGQAVQLVDALREHGHAPRFVDMGGGIPMSYLDSREEWDAFWSAYDAGLRGDGPALTFDGHRLRTSYPYHQTPTRGAWLDEVLAGSARALRERGLELRCEPGRSILDGCGATVARVEFRKQRADGTWLIGVAMNRTQCRSTSDDFLVDPLLLRPDAHAVRPTGPIEGYLVGAYCIERELLTWRRLRFPDGVAVGDLVVFPNTAGYLMHILESASHQIPLARNVVRTAAGELALDSIDQPSGITAPLG